MDEVIAQAECYLKGKESIMEKRSRDAKEKVRIENKMKMGGPTKLHLFCLVWRIL